MRLRHMVRVKPDSERLPSEANSLDAILLYFEWKVGRDFNPANVKLNLHKEEDGSLYLTGEMDVK